jgi:hypothetical protein
MQFGRLQQVEERWAREALGHVRQFLEKKQDRYFLYHSTFSEFITNTKTRDSYPDCYLAPGEWHRKIVFHYGGERWPWRGVHWDSLDDYGLQHLSRHMAGASLYKELYDLVTLGAERNAWADFHEKKEGYYTGYLQDLDLVWAWAIQHKSWNLGRQIRCMLIRSSIHSLAGNIAPELLLALIQKQHLTVAVTFAYVQHMPDAKQRAKALRLIASLLPEDLQKSAVQEANVLFSDPSVDEQERFNTLCTVVQHLQPELQARSIRRLWSSLQEIPDETFLAMKIGELWNILPDTLQRDALARIQKMIRQTDRADALTGIGCICPVHQREHVLALIKEIEDEAIRLVALSRLSAYLGSDEKEAILRRALIIKDPQVCLAILLHLLSSLAEDERDLAVNKAWVGIQRMADTDVNDAVSGLDSLIPYLSREQRIAAFTFVAERTLPPLLKVKTLFKLAEYLPSEQQDWILTQNRQLIQAVIDNVEINHAQARTILSALIRFFPYIEDKQKEQVINLALRIPGRHKRVWVLLEIAEPRFLKYLPEDMQDNLIATIQVLTQSIDDDGERATVMVVLAKYAMEPTSTEALQEARRIVEQQLEELPLEKSNKARTWLGMVPYLPSAQQMAAVNKAIALLQPLASPKEIADELLHMLPNTVLSDLIPELPGDLSFHLQDVLEKGHAELEQAQANGRNNGERVSHEQITTSICEALSIIKDRGNQKLAQRIERAISSWKQPHFFDFEEHRKLWSDTLQASALRGRKACMNDLVALIPLLLYVSANPESDGPELLDALCDVERWWH